MNIISGFNLFVKQALEYPLTSPFLPLVSKVKAGISYANSSLIGTLFYGLPRSGQNTSYVNYDDGYYKRGNPVSPRFTVHGDNSITDLATDLMWVASPALASGTGFNFTNVYAWADAITAISAMNTASYLGYSDWRLPNFKEIVSIVDFGLYLPAINGIFTSQPGRYWTSTTNAAITVSAWALAPAYGELVIASKTSVYYVRAVRG